MSDLTVQEAMQNFRKQVEQFLSAYHFMPAGDKARLEAELQSHIQGMDERTQKLYHALVSAAREGRNALETIQALEAVDGRKVYAEESRGAGS